jgi:DNA uptake protein ComE-like DNA-binding protein
MSSAIGNAKNVDLNSASEQDLESVGGLGRERAARIVQSRPFKSWDDVKAIEGFSDKLVQDLKSSVATLGNNG